MKKVTTSIFFTLSLFFGVNTLDAQLVYKDISEPSGVASGGQNIGVAFGDYDNDGDEDLYVSVRDGKNKLFKNIDGQRFINVADIAGVDYDGSSRTSIWLDINNDQLLDLYVGNFDENDLLYLNKGDGTFEDLTRWARIYNPARTFSVNAADVNRDGWIDIYVANFREENKLYINRGDNTFTNQVEESGARSVFNAMGAVFFDYDKDNDSDLYLTHDGQPYILYQNDGAGKFTDVSKAAGVDYDGFGMGVDVGDVNRDGWLDLYITNLYENVLFLNNKDGTFSNVSEKAQVEDYGMGWGTNFLDFNNDGYRDIYVTNDSYFSPFANVLYKNMGDGSFQIMDTEKEVASMQAGYGSAVADINGDGCVDLAVANAGSKDYFQLFANQKLQGNWIGFKLEGVENNRPAIGARLEMIDEMGRKHVDEVNAGSGYASMNSLILHFGLGQATKTSSVSIIWPNGQEQELDVLEAGHYYKVVEGKKAEILDQKVTSTQWESFLTEAPALSPNPVKDRLNIQFNLKRQERLHFLLINEAGQRVFSKINQQGVEGQQQFSFTLPDRIGSGFYSLLILGNNGVYSEKIIIQK